MVMTREEKIKKRKQRKILRGLKNRERNRDRWKRNGRWSRNGIRNTGENCPFDVEINNMYGTCNCGGSKRYECAMDI